ncbi:MAG: CHAT domain-containing protein [Cyanobacteria bacterium Co-bin13]|nr:CHAT domain-containing protein [Cyanobacteria bacterium Co-bin13]
MGPATIAANITTANRPLSFGFPVTIGGNVTLDVGASAISFENALAAGSNSLTLTADEIDFKDSVTGTGDLTLQPATQNQPIVLAGSQLTSGLDLTASELQQLQSGFSAVTIGSSTGSGEIRLGGPLEVNNPVILRSPNGSISLNNSVTTKDNGSLTLQGPTALTADITSGNRPLTFDSPLTIGKSITLNAGTSAIAFNNTVSAGINDLTLVADEIDFAGPVSGSGNLTLQAQNRSRITVGGSINDADLNLTTNDLRQLSNGFSSITIGRAGSGEITVQDNPTFSDPVTLQANTIAANSLTITGTDNASVTLAAPGGITSTGNVQIRAPRDITTRNISAPGSAVSLNSSGVVTTGNIDTRSTTAAPGGAVTIQAQTSITTGSIRTSSRLGSGGSVFLDPLLDITVGFIDAQGGANGVGGDITIATGRFFRATDSFSDQTGTLASLSSSGGLGGGTIAIRHGGGLEPFRVGDATSNGTAGAIVSGFSGGTLALNRGFRPIFDQIDLATSAGRIRIVNTGAVGNQERPCLENCSDTAVNLAVDQQEEIGAAPNFVITQDLDVDTEEALNNADSRLTTEINAYLGFGDEVKPISLEQVQADLRAVPQQIPALLVVGFGYSGSSSIQTAQGSARDSVPLELILITPNGEPIYAQVPEASRRQVLDTVERLRRQVSDPNLVGTDTYLESAQRLYRWIIAPLETTLAAQGITSLAFVMDEGLRSLPVAALHNGKTFLIENYSLGLIPSLNLVDLTYRDISAAPALIGGASEFATEAPLLSAGVEIEALQRISGGQTLTNAAFTISGLKQERPYQIVHLATHGAFLRGSAANSYLQFSDGRLRLNQLRELNWNDPPVDLVTLSACQTAMGNREAELGFAGLAIAAGARSALASLWKISDESTTGLMVEFYQQLREGEIKAAALREAQRAMIRGEVYTENSQLVWRNGREDLPAELAWQGRRDFSHPFYWAAFTLVGSPW